MARATLTVKVVERNDGTARLFLDSGRRGLLPLGTAADIPQEHVGAVLDRIRGAVEAPLEVRFDVVPATGQIPARREHPDRPVIAVVARSQAAASRTPIPPAFTEAHGDHVIPVWVRPLQALSGPLFHGVVVADDASVPGWRRTARRQRRMFRDWWDRTLILHLDRPAWENPGLLPECPW